MPTPSEAQTPISAVPANHTVTAIMSSPVLKATMDDSLESIRDLLARNRVHHLVVVEEHKVVGVISDRDVLHGISPFAGTPSERSLDSATLRKRAHQIMSRSVLTLRRDTTIAEAARLLLERRISCLPVLDDNGSCVGIVTTRDLLRWTVARLLAASDAAPRSSAA